jgi:hypothetical protein
MTARTPTPDLRDNTGDGNRSRSRQAPRARAKTLEEKIHAIGKLVDGLASGR